MTIDVARSVKKMFIDGKWTDSESGQLFEATSPATGEVIAQVPKGTRADAQRAVEAALIGGPVGSWEPLKLMSGDGGGFFNANSAHPFENPTPFTNFFELVLIFAIPSGLTYTLGRMTGSQRHGWAVWAAMAFLFLATFDHAGSPEMEA